MKKAKNKAVKALRKIIGRTQAEFAAMIGVSKAAVIAWENGRQLDTRSVLRILNATGADGVDLWKGSSRIHSSVDCKEYTIGHFDSWTNRSSSTRALVTQFYLTSACSVLQEVFTAASKPAIGGKVKNRLHVVVQSFLEWADDAVEKFQLASPNGPWKPAWAMMLGSDDPKSVMESCAPEKVQEFVKLCREKALARAQQSAQSNEVKSKTTSPRQPR